MAFLHLVDKVELPLDDSLIVMPTQNGGSTGCIDPPLIRRKNF
jgi:hypothetical protein